MIPTSDRGEPQRGHHVGQPVGRAVRLGGAAGGGAGARDLSGRGGPAPRRRRRQPGGRGRHHRRPGQPAHQLLGAGRRGASRTRRRPRGCAQVARCTPRRGHAGATARPARQGVRPAALRARSEPARPAAWPRAEACGAVGQADLARRGRRPRRARRHRRGARRQLLRRRRRDRGGGGSGPRRPAQGRGVERAATRCPTKASSPTGSRASRSRPPRSTSARRRLPHHVARTVRRQYTRPFIAHASMAPSCAIAQWTGADKVQIWSHCQGVYNLRADLALALGLPPENIVVQHVEGAGCYGHNGADDVAFDAVLLARAAGGPAGARAMVARGRARLGADGRRHGHRDRGRSRCGRRHRRLARRRLEQRPRLAARAHAHPDRARGLAARQAVRAPHRLQSADGDRRRRRAQRRAALRLSRPCASPATGC